MVFDVCLSIRIDEFPFIWQRHEPKLFLDFAAFNYNKYLNLLLNSNLIIFLK